MNWTSIAIDLAPAAVRLRTVRAYQSRPSGYVGFGSELSVWSSSATITTFVGAGFSPRRLKRMSTVE